MPVANDGTSTMIGKSIRRREVKIWSRAQSLEASNPNFICSRTPTIPRSGVGV